jgi:ubiquinone/menaquinone biosynthesis C-methylase UbiE
MMMEPKRLVEEGYDRIAEQYLASKEPLDPTALALLTALVRDLPPDAPVLDLGCGAGVPVTRWLAERHPITGVDVSVRQLALARQRVPTATLLQVDMTAINFPAASFGAVVALYSLIHGPRATRFPFVL